MQEVQVVRWCDWHLRRDGVKTPALKRPVTLGIDDSKADTDLCSECDELLAGPLRELLKAIGSRTEQGESKREVDKDGKPRLMVQCPKCPLWIDVRYRNSHVRSKHTGLRNGQIDWRYDETVDEVWACTCGLTLPTFKGREMHVRSKGEGCSIPERDAPIPPLRPA